MLSGLTLHQFRNLEHFQLRLEPGTNVLLGSNGSGKTSLLEAAHVAATTRSFRTAQIADCASLLPLEQEESAEPGFSVRAEVVGKSRAELAVVWNREGLQRSLNSKASTLQEYLGALPVIAWTAREDEILAGVPDRRRRMIDAGLVAEDSNNLGVLSRYRRALAQKRELLKRGHGGLEEWNRLLAEGAVELVAARSEWVARLRSGVKEALDESGLTFPPIDLRYEPSPPSALDGVESTFGSLAEVADEERRQRRPLLGPHRDRLWILWGGIDVSRVASAGERKALGLLLASAQAALVEARGKEPLILADDFDSELDLRALAAVWRVLGSQRQVLASTNREEILTTLEGALTHRLGGL